jgi:hypothetical protein
VLLVAVFIAAIVIIAALRNSQGTLFTALTTDVPGYVVWAAALLAVGAIGFVRPLKNVSDALIVLVITVLIVNNYSKIIAGVQAVATTDAGTTPSTSSGTTAGTAAGSAAGSLISGASSAVSAGANAAGAADSSGNVLDAGSDLLEAV